MEKSKLTKKPAYCCVDGTITCPGCDGEKESEFGVCAGCEGVGLVGCGKCGGKEPKQKTLEEAAEKYSRKVWGVYYDDVHPEPAITLTLGELSVEDFSSGAKWQAEKMYSEEEVISIVEKSRETGLTAEYLLLTEQFKKK